MPTMWRRRCCSTSYGGTCPGVVGGEGRVSAARVHSKALLHTLHAASSRLDPRCVCAAAVAAECIYAPFAARGFAREFVKDLEVCVGWGGWGVCHWRLKICMVRGPQGSSCTVPETSVACRRLYAMQAARPRTIVDLIRSAEQMRVPSGSSSGGGDGTPAASKWAQVTVLQPGNCERCGYITSQVGGGGEHVGAEGLECGRVY